MAQNGMNALEELKAAAQKGIASIDTDAIFKKAAEATDVIKEKTIDAKAAVLEAKDDIEEKITELDRMLEASVNEYNDAFTLMNDKGVRLFVERSRAIDSISFVQGLVNSIANTPKSFDSDFEEITMNRMKFTEACEYAERELVAARQAAANGAAGVLGGSAVAFMAPTAAMWVATTFGTASTGAAISTLTGAAATNAALAWLGGGALTAGGGGIAAGNALLALAGPIGWTIAGATLLSSIVVFFNKKAKLKKDQHKEIEAVKKNIECVKEIDARMDAILSETSGLRSNLNEQYAKAVRLHGADYQSLAEEDKMLLGALVNNTKSMSATFSATVGE